MHTVLCQIAAAPQSGVAFCAGRTTPQDITDNRVYFNQQLLNDGGGFNLNTSTFTATRQGYYWMSMSVGVDTNNQADAYMSGADRLSSIMRGTPVPGYDVVSRDEIFELFEQCGQVKVWSSYRVFSDGYLQTSFSGFSMHTVLDSPAVAFSFVRSSTYSCSLTSRVPFDIVTLDEGNGWSAGEYEYIAPTSGLYVLSLSVGSDPSDELAVGLYNYGAMITSIQLGSTDHGYESLSKTVVANVNAGEHVYAACYLYTSSILYSEVRAQTKFTGFLYR